MYPASGGEIIVKNLQIFEVDGLRAYAFSKAAVEAYAAQLGYTDYQVKFVFVPYGADSSFDYAITFYETKDIRVIADKVYFRDYISEGEVKRYTIIPEVGGTWVFTSAAENDSYASLLDADGKLLVENDDGGEYNNFYIAYELKAGETYYIDIRWWRANEAGYMPIIITPYQ